MARVAPNSTNRVYNTTNWAEVGDGSYHHRVGYTMVDDSRVAGLSWWSSPSGSNGAFIVDGKAYHFNEVSWNALVSRARRHLRQSKEDA